MTLQDLKKEIAKRLLKRYQSTITAANTTAAAAGLETEYDKLKRLTPKERYQYLKGQSFDHKNVKYYNYLALFNQVKAPQMTYYETGEERMKAFDKAVREANRQLDLLYPTDEEKGCTISRCVRTCRFYEPEGSMDDNELEEWYK